MKQKNAEYHLLTGLFFRLLPYQMLLIAINAVNGIIDSLFGSNIIGTSAMSAIGLYGPLNHFLYAATMMLVSGSQILYGRYIGKDRQHVQSVFSVNIIVSAGLSLLVSLLLVVGVVTGATRVLISQETDLEMLNHYILGQAVGILPLVVGQQLFAFLSLENQTRRTMSASIACFAFNALTDYIFVAAFRMGTFGLGLASAMSNWVFLLILAWYYIAGKSEWKFSFRKCRWSDAPEMVKLGYAGALSRFVEMFRCIIVNFLLLKYVGSVGISAFAASNSLLAITWSVPFGMVAVSRMLFSISMGEEDRRSLVDTMHIIQTRGMLVVCAVVAALILCAHPLTWLFYRDTADPVYHMTVMGFRLLPLCMPLAQISLHFAGYAQIAQKKALSIVLPIVDGAVGVVACSLVLIPRMGINGLYIANIINGAICFVVIAAASAISLKKMPKNLEDLMAIPDSFGVGPDERIDISVRDIEKVVEISGQVIDFCRDRGIDRRRAFIAGLCMEEMAGNIVEHGFTKDKKKHSIDIRVTHKDDEIILRLRDNCVGFDPAERRKVMEPEDPAKNCGIRLVYDIAKDVQYQNLLGLNVLTMRI